MSQVHNVTHVPVHSLLRSHRDDLAAVAKHLRWPESKVQAAVSYTEAFPEEINEALQENEQTGFESLKRMLPQTRRIDLTKASKH